ACPVPFCSSVVCAPSRPGRIRGVGDRAQGCAEHPLRSPGPDSLCGLGSTTHVRPLPVGRCATSPGIDGQTDARHATLRNAAARLLATWPLEGRTNGRPALRGETAPVCFGSRGRVADDVHSEARHCCSIARRIPGRCTPRQCSRVLCRLSTIPFMAEQSC